MDQLQFTTETTKATIEQVIFTFMVASVCFSMVKCTSSLDKKQSHKTRFFLNTKTVLFLIFFLKWKQKTLSRVPARLVRLEKLFLCAAATVEFFFCVWQRRGRNFCVPWPPQQLFRDHRAKFQFFPHVLWVPSSGFFPVSGLFDILLAMTKKGVRRREWTSVQALLFSQVITKERRSLGVAVLLNSSPRAPWRKNCLHRRHRSKSFCLRGDQL